MQSHLRILEQIDDRTERRLALLGFVGEEMRQRGAHSRPIIVGGTAVEWYTHGDYASKDVDVLVEETGVFFEVLKDFGFIKIGSSFYNESLDIILDFVGVPPAAVGDRYVKPDSLELYLDMEEGVVPLRLTVDMIRLEDIILDRLHAAWDWNAGKLEDAVRSRDFQLAVSLVATAEDLDLDRLSDHTSDMLPLWQKVLDKCRELRLGKAGDPWYNTHEEPQKGR